MQSLWQTARQAASPPKGSNHDACKRAPLIGKIARRIQIMRSRLVKLLSPTYRRLVTESRVEHVLRLQRKNDG